METEKALTNYEVRKCIDKLYSFPTVSTRREYRLQQEKQGKCKLCDCYLCKKEYC